MKQKGDHRPMTFPDLGRFTVNEKDQICLDGKPIEVQQVTLTKWQAALGTGAALTVIAQGVVNILHTLKIIL